MDQTRSENQNRPDMPDQPDKTKEVEHSDLSAEKSVLHGLHPFNKLICPFCDSSYFILDDNWVLSCAQCHKPFHLFEIEEEKLVRSYLSKMAELLPDSLSPSNFRRIRSFKNISFMLRLKIEELMKQRIEIGDFYIYLQFRLADYRAALFEEEETKAQRILKDMSKKLDLAFKELADFESCAFAVRYAINLASGLQNLEKTKEAFAFLKQAEFLADQALKQAEEKEAREKEASKQAENFRLIEEAKDLKALVFLHMGDLAHNEFEPEKARENFDLMYELLFDTGSSKKRVILEKDLILSFPEAALYYHDMQHQTGKSKKLLVRLNQIIEKIWNAYQNVEGLDLYSNAAALRFFVLFSINEKAEAFKEIKAWKDFWNRPEALSLLKADPVTTGRIYSRNMRDFLKAAVEVGEGKRGLNLVQAGLDYLQKNNRKIDHAALAFEQAVLHQTMADYYFSEGEWSKAVGGYQKMMDVLFDLIRKWPESWLIATSARDLVQDSNEKIELIDVLIPEELGRKDLDILLTDTEAYFLQVQVHQSAFKKDRSFRKKAKKISREYKWLGLDKKAQDYLKLSKKS